MWVWWRLQRGFGRHKWVVGLEIEMIKQEKQDMDKLCTVYETTPVSRCVNLARLYGILAYTISITIPGVENV